MMFDKPVLEVIKENYDKIFSAEKKVADFILENPQEAVNANVSELAKGSNVSDATVIRMCHHLGYKGYYQMRLLLAKDIGREENKEAEEILGEPSTVARIFQDYANDLTAIGNYMNETDMYACVNMIKECKQAHILAVGNTVPLSLYMGFRLGRLGVKCTYGIAPEYFMNHVNLADPEDIIIAISQSGSSRQIIQGMELGREKNLKMMAITGYAQSPVSEIADYALVSNVRRESFNYYKNYAHLRETAVIDVLLELLTNYQKIREVDADKPEVIMAEYKY